jgi:tetratricopeptide (TPR) repeat protein
MALRNDLRSMGLQSVKVLLRILSCLLALAALAPRGWGQTLEQAERAFDAGKYAEAARLFEKAQQESANCEALFGLGLARYRLKQVDSAVISFRTAIQCDPNLIVAYLALGEAYSERSNYKEALASYLQALKLNPRNSGALRGAAFIYDREKVPQKAIELLERLIQVEPNDPQGHVDLGAEYLAIGNQEGSEAQFQEALRLKPDEKAALLGLGNVYLRKGDADAAIAMLRKVIKLAPNAPEPRFVLGSAYNRKARYEEALVELTNALRLGLEDPEAYYHLARAYGGLGKTEERSRALAKFSELTKKSKQDAEAQRASLKLVESAKAKVESGELSGAASVLEQARELRPSDDTILFRLASVNYDLNRDAAAKSYAEEAISLAPSEWVYHYLLGIIELRAKQWQQSRSSLQVALQLNHSAAEIHNALGQIAIGEGNAKGALTSFQRAVEMDPSKDEYRSNLESARRAVAGK